MAALRRDFLPEDLAQPLTAAGLHGVIAVQARTTEHETEFLLRLMDDSPIIQGIVGWFDLTEPDIGTRLADIDPRIVGFREILQGQPDEVLMQPELARGIRALAEHRLSYDLLIYERQLPAAIHLVDRCPETTFVLDHLAKPQMLGGPSLTWRDQIARLAERPNVIAKVSGLATEFAPPQSGPTLFAPYVSHLRACFSDDRLLFGSDWPVSILAGPYGTVATDLLDAVPFAAEQARRAYPRLAES